MIRISAITSSLLYLLSIPASANMPYGQPPAPYYGYPAPVYHPHYPPPRPYFVPAGYHRAPAYPLRHRSQPLPERKLPETRNEKFTGTVAAISKPEPIVKPAVLEVKQPTVPEPKKVLPDSKMVFLNKLAPIVHEINQMVRQERDRLVGLIRQLETDGEIATEELSWLKSMKKKYRVKAEATDAEVLRQQMLPKVDVIPVELALAQAANESAWGKSRFAREAQNLFGVWTYDESKGIVPKQRAKGARHLVRKYESLEASVRHYIVLLNSHPAYKPLREIRQQHRLQGDQPDGYAMAEGLIKYSAKGEQYVAIIRSMISKNNLVAFRSA
mgnify:CR=1 FL=1